MCIAYRVTKLSSFLILFLMSVMMVSSTATPVSAGDTGLARMLHTLQKEHRKTCMVGHFHYGSSKGEKTRRRALKAAKRSWMSFTAFEYGSDWASFRNSATKGKKCSKADDGTYGCSVSARPCKKR